MHRCITLSMACYLGVIGLTMTSNALAQAAAVPASGCESPDALAVIPADRLPALLGKPIRQITLLHYRDQQLSPITSQIDQRDADGRYLLDDESAPDNRAGVLGPDDEIVFRLADRAKRRPPASASVKETTLVEVEVNDPQTGETGWVYAGLSDPATNAATDKKVAYETQTDSVETGVYKVGFSNQHPFLIDTFQWKLAANSWSPDVLDAMKIRHQGTMFGFFSFRRTSKDYSSKLTRVKTGPLRIIRRTKNRVRILWELKTPVLYIDYVMMPDGFVMDTIVDIPFNLGLFFSDVETLTTVDWRNDPALPELTIRSPGTTSSLVVSGQMSDEKSQFNTINDTRLSVHSAYGSVSLKLDIPDDFPVQPWLYLNDRADVADPPENQAGQFGNVGYRTTGWENIDTEVHHLKFTTCVIAAEAGHGP
ncbi:MAG: hypothetical protein BMS9Abin09_0500 [Gammaproteobacteria bacterium]|nr:MAG: hypothetical protein BMS9Abin09_0500 [Gammaproteobacteria bacterium]